MAEKFHYDAFISYRHSEKDMYVAKTLHKKLESFKVPKSVLAKHPGMKTKIERVFRDQEELPLSDNLSDPIDQALENSDFLIVVCTPRLPESRWCQREIEKFIGMHGRDHVLVVLAEGEPVDSFPEILTYEDIEVTNEDGTVSIERRELEPLGAEARGKNKREINKNLDDAVIKIAAAMYNLNYDDLKQRHREQKMKKRATVMSICAGVFLVFGLVCFSLLLVINSQKLTISSQYLEIQEKYGQAQADKAFSLLGSGRRYDAVETARQVLPGNGNEAVYTSDAFYALCTGLNIYGTGDKYLPDTVYEVPSRIIEMSFSENGNRIAICDKTGTVYVFDRDGTLLGETKPDGEFVDSIAMHFATDDILYLANLDGIYRYDIMADKLRILENSSSACIIGCNKKDQFIYYADGYIIGIDENGKEVYASDVLGLISADQDMACLLDAALSNNLDKVAVLINTGDSCILAVIDSYDGTVQMACILKNSYDAQVALGRDDVVVVSKPTEFQGTGTVMAACYNAYTADMVWSISIPKENYDNLSIINIDGYEYALGYADTLVGMYDVKSGNTIYESSTDSIILAAYFDEKDSSVKLIMSDGSIKNFEYSYESINDISSSIYGISPVGYYSQACIAGPDIYLQGNDSNYAVRYVMPKKAETVYEQEYTEISKDGIYIMCRDVDNVIIYNLQKEEIVYKKAKDEWCSYTFSPFDENVIISWGDSLNAYDFAEDEELFEIDLLEDGYYLNGISKNEDIAVFSDDKGDVIIYELKDGKKIAEITNTKDSICNMVFGLNCYAYYSEGILSIYDYDGTELASTDFNCELLEEAVFSDDGKYLLIRCLDDMTYIYDVKTLEMIGNTDELPSYLDSMSFYDGIYIISGLHSSYILDDSFNVIYATEKIELLKDNMLYIKDTECLRQVEYLDYDSILKMADKYLEN